MRRIVSAAFALTLFLPFAAFAQNFNYQTDVGYTRLKAEQGAGTPAGSNREPRTRCKFQQLANLSSLIDRKILSFRQ